MALAAHPEVGYAIDEVKAIRMLAHAMDGQPRSLLKGAEPLWPGHLLSCEAGKLGRDRFYLPDPERRLPQMEGPEYAAEFRRLLTQAVTRRLSHDGETGVMLSGGLDSVPIAIAAAGLSKQKGQSLKSYTWVFDEHEDVDERKYIKGVVERLGIEAQHLPADQIWHDWKQLRTCNPILPFTTPFLALQDALLQRAAQDGTRVILSGLGGDMLYTGTGHLFAHLLKQGRILETARQGISAWRHLGSPREFLRRYLVNVLRKPKAVKAVIPDWLTNRGKQTLQDEESWLADEQCLALRPDQYFNVIGTLEGEDISYGRHLDAAHGVERRYPFRDRELAEFLLAVPTEQLFWRGVSRPIVRAGYKDSLPASVLNRIGKTDFSSFMQSGIGQDNHAKALILGKDRFFGSLIDLSYLPDGKCDSPTHSLLRWRLGYYEWWKTLCYTPSLHGLDLDIGTSERQ